LFELLDLETKLAFLICMDSASRFDRSGYLAFDVHNVMSDAGETFESEEAYTDIPGYIWHIIRHMYYHHHHALYLAAYFSMALI
jgi:hypothetical protein